MGTEVYCPKCLNKFYLTRDEPVNVEDIRVDTSVGEIRCPYCREEISYELRD